jgi:hypothetical protein
MAAGGNDQQQYGPNVSAGEARTFLVSLELDELVGLSALEADSWRDELTVELTRAGSPPRL